MGITKCKISGDGFNATIDGTEWQAIKAGSRFWPIVQDWIAAGNTPEPEYTEAEALELTQSESVRAVKAEALQRITALVPAINSLAMVDLMAELWPGLNTASLGQDVKDAAGVYTVAKAEIIAINSMDAAALALYDPTAW